MGPRKHIPELPHYEFLTALDPRIATFRSSGQKEIISSRSKANAIPATSDSCIVICSKMEFPQRQREGRISSAAFPT